jgi:hypothetical protein
VLEGSASVIEDCDFTGTGSFTSAPSSWGSYPDNTPDFYITGVVIKNSSINMSRSGDSGDWVSKIQYARNWSFINNTITLSRTGSPDEGSWIWGFYWCSNIAFQDNTINLIDNTGTTPGSDLYMTFRDSCTAINMTNNLFNCSGSAPDGSTFMITNSGSVGDIDGEISVRGITAIGNTFNIGNVKSGRPALEFQSHAENVHFSGNVINASGGTSAVGGGFGRSGTTIAFIHNTIAKSGGGAVFAVGRSGTSADTLAHNIFYNRDASTEITTGPDAWTAPNNILTYAPNSSSQTVSGTNNLWGDPAFVDASYATFDGTLGEGSAAANHGNWSWSHGYVGAFSPDTTPPAAVSDLLVEFVSSTSVILSWTAPGDDGNTGTAAEYDVRYSTSAITESNWIYATHVTNEDPPQAAGEEELLAVQGLSSCTTYYFAIKTRDECHNWSALGTAEGQQTLCGGGGGFAAAPVEAGRSAEATSALGLPQDQLALELVTAAGVPGWTATRTASAELEVEERLAGGIHVQVGDGTGGWRTGAHVVPVAGDSLVGIRLPHAERRRVVFAGDFALRHIAGRTVNRLGAVVEVDAVVSSRLGDVSAEVDAETGGLPAHEMGDTLEVRYAGSVAEAGERFFAVVGGSVAGGAAESRSLPAAPPAVPLAFALGQSRPHPASGVARIQFDLPRAERVRLEVFDLQGRRVAMLADQRYAAGSHVVDWNPGDASPRVRPGVYVYRLTAGPDRAQRRLVVVP